MDTATVCLQRYDHFCATAKLSTFRLEQGNNAGNQKSQQALPNSPACCWLVYQLQVSKPSHWFQTCVSTPMKLIVFAAWNFRSWPIFFNAGGVFGEILCEQKFDISSVSLGQQVPKHHLPNLEISIIPILQNPNTLSTETKFTHKRKNQPNPNGAKDTGFSEYEQIRFL